MVGERFFENDVCNVEEVDDASLHNMGGSHNKWRFGSHFRTIVDFSISQFWENLLFVNYNMLARKDKT